MKRWQSELLAGLRMNMTQSHKLLHQKVVVQFTLILFISHITLFLFCTIFTQVIQIDVERDKKKKTIVMNFLSRGQQATDISDANLILRLTWFQCQKTSYTLLYPCFISRREISEKLSRATPKIISLT